jgi:hypothetical protein
VIIAADGPVKKLLQEEFPNVVFTVLKGYKIHYSKHRRWFYGNLFFQFPKILRRIYQENKWLKKTIATHHIDAVISDNRMGLHTTQIPCIYITHQLKIKTGNSITEWIAQKIHYHFINKYNTCWVPDNVSSDDLAGALSHPKKLPAIPVKYIGPLSRFEKINIEKKYDLLLLLSGPEPQRTILETLLLQELKNYAGTCLMVRGLPGSVNDTAPASNDQHTIVNHLPAAALNKTIQQSGMVISRSGYTTVMDLAALQQKAILIATPGQTEQEYLAEYLMQRKLFYCTPQKNFTLKDALSKAAVFNYKEFNSDDNAFKKIIKDFILQVS